MEHVGIDGHATESEIWDRRRRSRKAKFLGGDRKLLTSAGMALRVNLFGFAVGELDFVHPNDRPSKNWYWQSALQPGF